MEDLGKNLDDEIQDREEANEHYTDKQIWNFMQQGLTFLNYLWD